MGQIKDFIEYVLQIFKIWVIIQPWEEGLIVRNGKRIRKRKGGIYFKVPYFDSVYVQETRLRVSEVSMQTLTSKDGKTLTVSSSFGYIISDLRKLYDTLYLPENTLNNFVMGLVAEIVSGMDAEELKPSEIQKRVYEELRKLDYGLDIRYFKINNFALVRTFRIIKDDSWVPEGARLDTKK